MKTLAERFEKKYVPEPSCGCWLWTGAISPSPKGTHPYGIFYTPQASKRLQMAHRVSYEMAKGPIPEGLELDHLCRVTLCVNPEHLEPVTSGENTRRGHNAQRDKTHCVHGHELSGANLYIKQGKYRECVTCRKAQWQRYVERHAEAQC